MMQHSTLSRCKPVQRHQSCRPCRQNRRSLHVTNLFTGIVQGIATVAEVNSKVNFVQMQVAFPAGKMAGIQVSRLTRTYKLTGLRCLLFQHNTLLWVLINHASVQSSRPLCMVACKLTQPASTPFNHHQKINQAPQQCKSSIHAHTQPTSYQTMLFTVVVSSPPGFR